MKAVSVAEGFLRSCVAIDPDRGARLSLDAVRLWIHEQRGSARMRVERIPFAAMDAWRFTQEGPIRLRHDSGRFFTVEGARFRSTVTGDAWEQPVLNQPETGLLGLLMAVLDGTPHFLAQAKWEPGNSARQLSPTVQATHSNYTRAHGGREQPFLDRFMRPRRDSVVFDALMPEHGSYFLRKLNRNMVVQVEEDLLAPSGFLWLTLGQLKVLLAEDDVVHMDTRSVLGCLPLGARGAGEHLVNALGLGGRAAAIARSASAAEGVREVEAWLRPERFAIEHCSLDAMPGWVLEQDAIRPLTVGQKHAEFSVIAVRVEASRREVDRWTQPIIAPSRSGFLGLMCAPFNDGLSFLAEARPEPGHDGFAQVFPTVTTDDVGEAPLAEHFRHVSASQSIFSARSSEEGGRFFHYDNRFSIIDVPPSFEVPLTHRWLTLGQLGELAQQGRVSMEMRNLLACLPVAGKE